MFQNCVSSKFTKPQKACSFKNKCGLEQVTSERKEDRGRRASVYKFQVLMNIMLCRLKIFTDVSGKLTACFAVQGHFDCMYCENDVSKYYTKSSFNSHVIFQKIGP